MAKARGNDARGADEATQTVDEIMDRAMQKMMEEMIQVYGNLMMAHIARCDAHPSREINALIARQKIPLSRGMVQTGRRKFKIDYVGWWHRLCVDFSFHLNPKMAALIGPDPTQVYKGDYSGVPVYEQVVGENIVMRRQKDDWINATHVLKVADLDKPARTRVLEKEIQTSTHEKIQGGYGRFQGTWVPLAKAVEVATKYRVADVLAPIFNFVPGPDSPPEKPKVARSAPVNRARAPKASAPKRPLNQVQGNGNGNVYAHRNGDSVAASDSVIDDDMTDRPAKRSRVAANAGAEDAADHDFRAWADNLLDYFMLAESGEVSSLEAPDIPPGVDIDRPVDQEGHTALAWAAAMGDVTVTKQLLTRSADEYIDNCRGETPLIRACLFANCYEKGTFPQILELLIGNLTVLDNFGGSVLHHCALSSTGVFRSDRARYYMEVLFRRLKDHLSAEDFKLFLNCNDNDGNTAFHIAARCSKKVTKVFIAYGADDDLPNNANEAVWEILEARHRVKAEANYNTAHAVATDPNQPVSSSPVHSDDDGGDVEVYNPPPKPGDLIGGLRSGPSKNAIARFCAIGETLQAWLAQREAELGEKDALLRDCHAALHRVRREREDITARLQALKDNLGDGVLVHAGFQASAEREQTALMAEAAAVNRLIARFDEVVYGGQGGSGGSDGGSAAGTMRRMENGETTDHGAVAETVAELQAERRKQRTLAEDLARANADQGMSDEGRLAVDLVCKSLDCDPPWLAANAEDIVREMQANADASKGE